MHLNKIDLIAEKIGSLAGKMFTHSIPVSKPRTISYRSGMMASLDSSGVELLRSIVGDLMSDPGLSKRLSKSDVNKKILDIITEMLQNDEIDKPQHYLEEFITEVYSNQSRQVVYVPLAGIEMSVTSLTLGKVTLKKISPKMMKKMVGNLDTLRPEFESNLMGNVCALVKVDAEPERARQRALKECYRSLDLIRYALPTFYPSCDVFIGVVGDLFFGIQPTLIVTEGGGFSLMSESKPTWRYFQLSRESVAEMRRIGVFQLSKILLKNMNECTKFEGTLIQAVHWFAEGQTLISKENQFLNLMTCLETLLTPGNNVPISNSVAECAALVLEKRFEERLNTKQLIRDLYNKRSRLSHGGSNDIAQDQLDALRDIARRLLLFSVRNIKKFHNRKQLHDWIERKKLS